MLPRTLLGSQLHERLTLQLLDVLINHAGILYGASPDEPDFEQFEVNVFGALQVTHTLLRHSKVELLTVRMELDRQFNWETYGYRTFKPVLLVAEKSLTLQSVVSGKPH